MEVFELKELLASDKKMLGVIKEELKGIADKYGDERRTRVVKSGVKSMSEEDLIPEEESVLVLTQGGYIKRTNPSEYKKHKQLPEKSKANLRDHMNDLELIFTMLGEKVTTEITKNKNAQGFQENKQTAREGGTVAGNARREAEEKIGKTTVSDENYLDTPEKEKRKRLT